MKNLLIGLALIITLSIGAIIVFLVSHSDDELVLTCTTSEQVSVSTVACAHLKWIRSPDPNQLVNTDTQQTLFGFILAGIAKGDTSPQTYGLVEHFSDQVAFDKGHDRGMTPLHLGVLYGSNVLVKQFLKAGASVDVKASAPNKPYHQMTSYDYAVLLLQSAKSKKDPVAIKTQDGIVLLLKAAGARPGPATPRPPISRTTTEARDKTADTPPAPSKPASDDSKSTNEASAKPDNTSPPLAPSLNKEKKVADPEATPEDADESEDIEEADDMEGAEGPEKAEDPEGTKRTEDDEVTEKDNDVSGSLTPNQPDGENKPEEAASLNDGKDKQPTLEGTPPRTAPTVNPKTTSGKEPPKALPKSD